MEDEKIRTKRLREAAYQNEEGGQVRDQPAEVEKVGTTRGSLRSREKRSASLASRVPRPGHVCSEVRKSLVPRGVSPWKPFLGGEGSIGARNWSAVNLAPPPQAGIRQFKRHGHTEGEGLRTHPLRRECRRLVARGASGIPA